MTENLFTAVLTFSLVAGGATAIGSEMFTTRQAPHTGTSAVVSGTVVAPEVASAQVIVMPLVTVTGRKFTTTRVAMAQATSSIDAVQ